MRIFPIVFPRFFFIKEENEMLVRAVDHYAAPNRSKVVNYLDGGIPAGVCGILANNMYQQTITILSGYYTLLSNFGVESIRL